MKEAMIYKVLTAIHQHGGRFMVPKFMLRHQSGFSMLRKQGYISVVKIGGLFYVCNTPEGENIVSKHSLVRNSDSAFSNQHR